MDIDEDDEQPIRSFKMNTNSSRDLFLELVKENNEGKSTDH